MKQTWRILYVFLIYLLFFNSSNTGSTTPSHSNTVSQTPLHNRNTNNNSVCSTPQQPPNQRYSSNNVRGVTLEMTEPVDNPVSPAVYQQQMTQPYPYADNVVYPYQNFNPPIYQQPFYYHPNNYIIPSSMPYQMQSLGYSMDQHQAYLYANSQSCYSQNYNNALVDYHQPYQPYRLHNSVQVKCVIGLSPGTWCT